MEEDIKILEEFINYKNIIDTPYHLIAISHERLCEAIETILTDYEKQQNRLDKALEYTKKNKYQNLRI